MPSRYQLVIFDFDGTLADSLPWFTQAFNGVAERYRIRRLEADELESLRSLSSREIIAHLGVPLWKLPLIARTMRQAMAREIDQIRLFPGVDELLHALHARGIVLAVVTSNSAENVKQVLGSENASLFRYYQCSAGLLGKRTALRRILRASGVAQDRVLSIGDELRDLEASHAERLAFGAVTWGYTSPEILESHEPEELFRRVADINERLS